MPESYTISADAIAAQLERILDDRTEYRKLLEKRGQLAQSLLDLFQTISDYPNVRARLRSKILAAMLRLAKESGLYPKMFALHGIQTLGEYPVASGGFGEIFRGDFGGQAACLKVIKIYRDSDIRKLLNFFLQEAILWRQLDHPNVVPFLGLYFLGDDNRRLCLLSPWMENGNVVQYLEAHAGRSINRVTLACDVANGLSYLHEMKIVHGDLKGANILITDAARAVIADFGLSRVADSEVLRWTSLSSESRVGGTARWLAPECLLQGCSATYASDVYAFGCLFTGHMPFYQLSQDAAVILQVVQGKRPALPEDVQLSEGIWAIVEECWCQEASQRPLASVLPRRFLLAGAQIMAPPNPWGIFRARWWSNIQHPELCSSGSDLDVFLFGGEAILDSTRRRYVTARSSFEGSGADNASAVSSVNTWSTTTDDIGLFDAQGQSNSSLLKTLKQTYREIVRLEAILGSLEKDTVPEGPLSEYARSEMDGIRWKEWVQTYESFLDNMQNLMLLSALPSLPKSIQVIPSKYNVPGRLWKETQRLYQQLHAHSQKSPVGSEYLYGFFCDTYTFYTNAFENDLLRSFRDHWIQALCDLSYIRLTKFPYGLGSGGVFETEGPVVLPASECAAFGSSCDSLADDDPQMLPSVSSTDVWRRIAKDWVCAGLQLHPSNGRLHHQLALICRENMAEEGLRHVYHFLKSICTLHPYTPSPEERGTLRDLCHTKMYSHREASVIDLFMALHMMLYTGINHDGKESLEDLLTRFMDLLRTRIAEEDLSEQEWTMMAVMNTIALLGHGRRHGSTRLFGLKAPMISGQTRRSGLQTPELERLPKLVSAVSTSSRASSSGRSSVTEMPEGHDIDSDKDTSQPNDPDGYWDGIYFHRACTLSFKTLSLLLNRLHETLPHNSIESMMPNPYLVIMAMFLAKFLECTTHLNILGDGHGVAWEQLSRIAPVLEKKRSLKKERQITSPPLFDSSPLKSVLPEDWCLLGLEWIHTDVYKKDFWTGKQYTEMGRWEEVRFLDNETELDMDEKALNSERMSVLSARWVRLIRCSNLFGMLPGTQAGM
ncbi:hypothetical protein D9758_007247 [Tetrapyrgos nigripes]|uniref:Protein kinase domain-containing protein n=1 Tax=Tetrapyrgos nigripes TaxID=182062 RepID=A0A8H5FWI1_9AGAR|nr:hypothetical protein D9758_007247 [Tetrapyrgos nigripes]